MPRFANGFTSSILPLCGGYSRSGKSRPSRIKRKAAAALDKCLKNRVVPARRNWLSEGGIQAPASAVQEDMAEKVKRLNLERDYKKYLYFIDGSGNVCQKPKSGEGENQVLV